MMLPWQHHWNGTGSHLMLIPTDKLEYWEQTQEYLVWTSIPNTTVILSWWALTGLQFLLVFFFYTPFLDSSMLEVPHQFCTIQMFLLLLLVPPLSHNLQLGG